MTTEELIRHFKQYNDEAMKRVLEHKPDKLDTAMRKRGLMWSPLENEWVRIR